MRRRAPALALACLACAGGPTSPEAAPVTAGAAKPDLISFRALAPGDELRVRMHAVACFVDRTAAFSFRAAKGGLTVRSIVTDNGRRPSPPEVRDTLLADADRARLDRLLAFYRGVRPDQICSAWQGIELELVRAGVTVRRERFEDSSCGAHEVPGVLTLYDLVRPR